MRKQKLILNYCPYFYKIINFEFYEDDVISKKLIMLYRDYIFSVDVMNKRDLLKAQRLDLILSKYIDDYVFRKALQKDILNINVPEDEAKEQVFINGIFNIYDAYESGYTRNIYFARWI